ncbi:T9SS type A sorting domain-containing protein [Cryomorpha ignava]|uniref:T9SS type A sorting domain-containing protein n=1 Tax=Cryomorpha ignava TaxID=101383 RepID=A0A7K3WLH2_9FLAO|nr:T9SS type A sorting domain-containing protein [Cryomorpha ignava]NEN22368.1 T9SS type A sorting domain-containing protein [Cryomorpha ignava]
MTAKAQPNWSAIKSNATFIVADTNYLAPTIQPINVGGWEDGLYITRDGKHLYSTYLPIDAFSWIGDISPCINFVPYFRPPLLGIDTVTNPFGCPNYMHSDIILASKSDTSLPFNPWTSSNLATSATMEGGAHGVLLNSDTFDVFVYTTDNGSPWGMEIMFMKNVSINPNTSTAISIVSSIGAEDNPHIERIDATTLLLIFDRDRYIYYSLSYDNGATWEIPIQMTNVLNDQAPYDVQPHLWNDGVDWWVYFCADNINNRRCIYKSKQLIANDWNSWGPKQLVIEPSTITDGSGIIFGVGEPTLTQWGDLSFVVIYGDIISADSTDVYDCDPWILKRKNYPLSTSDNHLLAPKTFNIYPNPSGKTLNISLLENQETRIQIFNIMGIFLKEISITQQAQIDISDFPSGMYFVRLKDDPLSREIFIKSSQ